jgi:YegS/Rv2252/BmrU family lipid kinase
VIEVALDGARDVLSRTIVARREEFDAVVVGGGDGTLLTAIAGLIETKLPLAILPLGTFNELARTLGVPFDAGAVAALIDDGASVQLDVGRVNGVHFFNEASVGLSTRVARLQTGDVKRALGMLAIPITTLRALRALRPLHLEIESDGGAVRRVRAVQLTVANSYRFGGVVENPEGSLEDGRLWLYSIDVRGWLGALRVVASVAARRFTRTPEVEAVAGTHFAVRSRSGRAHRVFADSEYVARLPAEFTIVPKAVSVLVPPRMVDVIR